MLGNIFALSVNSNSIKFNCIEKNQVVVIQIKKICFRQIVTFLLTILDKQKPIHLMYKLHFLRLYLIFGK